MRNLTIPALAAAMVLAPSGAALAQQMPQQEADYVDDIVVTAQRRAERVTDVPISISVANAAQLERQQVNTLNDLNRIAPSLEIQQAPGQNTGGGGAIRGIGTQTFSPGATASVGVVVDQVSQGNANIADLFDVSRIEVLKGPQGTLFGLTTSAGVINITTNAPDPSAFGARLRTELSGEGLVGSKFGNQVFQGMLNLPLADNAALRLSGVANRRQGVNRNAYTGEWNDNDRYGGRARLWWQPSANLTLNAIADYTRTSFENGGDFFTFVRTGGPGPFLGGVAFDPIGNTARLASCGIVPQEGNQDYCTTQTSQGRNANYGASLQADYALGDLTLTSITAIRRNHGTGTPQAGNIFRADPLELEVVNGNIDRNLDLVTQELRLSSGSGGFLEYTLGAYYSRSEEERDPETLAVTLKPAPNVFIPIVRSLGARDRIEDESVAVFGQGTINVSDALRLIAGARYTSFDLSLDRRNLDAAGAAFGAELSDEVFSYRLGAQYDISDATMTYATISRGFKGGQIATPTLPLTPYAVQPEIPTAYEAGLKTTLFDGWVADLSVFYQNIEDFQSQQCTINPATAAISCVQTNIPEVVSKGAEINFFGRVSENLSINTGFIYTDASYPSDFIGTDGTNIGDTQLAYAPETKFTLSGEYERPITASLNGFVALDTVWKSEIRYEANSLRETVYDAHWMVGGRVGVRSQDDRFTAAIFVRNLFNEHEPSLLQSDLPYNGGQNVGAIYGPQSFRLVGISLDGKF